MLKLVEPSEARKQIRRIYKDVCGFSIPAIEEKTIHASKGSSIYGEATFGAIAKIAEYVKLGPNDIFYDLGSGLGKAVLQIAMTTPVKKCIGIELSQSRFDEAVLAFNAAKKLKLVGSRCRFVHGDILTYPLRDASVIYTCSTAFSINFLNKVAKRLSQLKRPFTLVTAQELDKIYSFKKAGKLKVDMSWSRGILVYVYKHQL